MFDPNQLHHLGSPASVPTIYQGTQKLLQRLDSRLQCAKDATQKQPLELVRHLQLGLFEV